MAGEETVDGKPWGRKVADTSENREEDHYGWNVHCLALRFREGFKAL